MATDDAEHALYAAYVALYYLLSDKVELVYIHRQKAIVGERIAALQAVCGGSTGRIEYAKFRGWLEVYG